MNKQRIIISRTDKIGDVVLTLPMAGIIKNHYPEAEIMFLGNQMVEPIIRLSEPIDQFLNWSDIETYPEQDQIDFFRKLKADVFIHVFPDPQIARLAKKAGIPLRMGTGHRLYHLNTCNKILFFSRKKSDLHESQLNLKLLKPLGISRSYKLSEMPQYYGLKLPEDENKNKFSILSSGRFNLILHPTSKGSAREWGLDNYSKLIELLPDEHYKIFISGTREDKQKLGDFIEKHHNRVTDISGMYDLNTFIHFIKAADGLVAASTGPLHIASALGKTAIGLYAPMRPIHPGRWGPVGDHAHILVQNKECNKCRKSNFCECIHSISPEAVKKILEEERVYSFA